MRVLDLIKGFWIWGLEFWIRARVSGLYRSDRAQVQTWYNLTSHVEVEQSNKLGTAPLSYHWITLIIDCYRMAAEQSVLLDSDPMLYSR